MARPVIVLPHPIHEDVTRRLAAHARLVVNTSGDAWTYHELLDVTTDAVGIMAFMTERLDASFIDACCHLRVVAGAFKGHDNIDVPACTERGIWVTTVPDLLTEPTADLALTLLLALDRNVLLGDRLIRAGRFNGWRPDLYGTGLRDGHVGIIGFGALGRTIATRLGWFGIKVMCTDPNLDTTATPERGNGPTPATFDTVIEQSDAVIVAAPLTESTRRLIDHDTLDRMRPGSLLVNIGRGSVVDEDAVAAALAAGKLGGYAADVYAMEDLSLPDRPRTIPAALVDHHRTVLTPHLGSAVAGVRHQIEHRATDNLIAAIQGRRPRDAVNDPQARPANPPLDPRP